MPLGQIEKDSAIIRCLKNLEECSRLSSVAVSLPENKMDASNRAAALEAVNRMREHELDWLSTVLKA